MDAGWPIAGDLRSSRSGWQILDWPPDQRGWLLSVAQMLARKAAAKEPRHPEYRNVLERILQLQP